MDEPGIIEAIFFTAAIIMGIFIFSHGHMIQPNMQAIDQNLRYLNLNQSYSHNAAQVVISYSYSCIIGKIVTVCHGSETLVQACRGSSTLSGDEYSSLILNYTESGSGTGIECANIGYEGTITIQKIFIDG